MEGAWIASVRKVSGTFKEKKKNDSDKCIEYFELGFAEHADPEISGKLKKDIDNRRLYHLRVYGPKKNDNSKSKDEVAISV